MQIKSNTLQEALVGPHIDLGDSGVAAFSSTGDEAVSYLRRLKGPQPERPGSNATSKDIGKAPTDATNAVWKELRQSPRLRCSGSVEFRVEGSDECMWGTLTDISLHGCYVEANTTFPIGTKVALVLKSFGIRIQTPGTVRTSYPSQGMGIGYTEIEPGQKQHLKQLLDGLIARGSFTDGVSAAKTAETAPGPLDPKGFLDEMTEFFRSNQLLSREEFRKMAKRVCLF
jgi:PilZ domain